MISVTIEPENSLKREMKHMFLNTTALRWVMRALLVASILFLASPGRAQTPAAPNLSGNWELVEFDGNRNNSDPKFPKMTLVIEQESNKLKITERRIKQGREEVRTFVYYTDGRGETNTSRVELWRSETPHFETVTHTDRNGIVTKYKRELRQGTSYASDGPGYYVPRDTSGQQKDQWNVDASGKTLTLTTRVLNIHSALVSAVKTPPADPLSSQGDPSAPTAEFRTYKLKFKRT